jgi:hypothetical protein
MDKLNAYREAIKSLILDYAQYKPSHGDIDPEVVFDTERDHYELMMVGWRRTARVHGSVIHIDLRGGKVWIQHNGTEGDLGEELMELGVAREDIVIGYRQPEVRQYTGYALG